MADARLAPTYRRRFPRSLQGAPLLLPAGNTAIRRSLDHWFDTLDVRPEILGEFDDSELLWEFGRAGDGIFPVLTVLEAHLTRMYGVPAVVAICETARQKLFGPRR